MRSIRPVVVVILTATALLLTTLAFASPPDPTWVGGFWDAGDFDDVVIAATSVVAIPTLHRVDESPTRTVIGRLLDAPTPIEIHDVPRLHPPRSPPAPFDSLTA